MKLRNVILICIALLCSGCFPTTQIRYYHRRGDISVIKDPGEPLTVDVRTPTLDRNRQGEIDTKRSFTTDSHGRRYDLIAKKNDFSESLPNGQTYFLRRDLWRISPTGRRIPGWPYGDWQLHIERVSSQGRETYDAAFKLWLLIWTPFLGLPA